ncbi:hypothetical protein SLEP1_g35418 [Rubroshorea leprosula]|uniref:Uncharacterized protein n=1 Tax=Rubroshorea leprosula TaxID=152421 RepID=A0AAV5KN70_9ROSI|nr:hypothetical protein SLEP1_g35418 [Rubroshorea leprosula]
MYLKSSTFIIGLSKYRWLKVVEQLIFNHYFSMDMII